MTEDRRDRNHWHRDWLVDTSELAGRPSGRPRIAMALKLKNWEMRCSRWRSPSWATEDGNRNGWVFDAMVST